VRGQCVAMIIGLSLGGAAVAGAQEARVPRTYLFLYAESPAVARYAREHGSVYRREPWMSDEQWAAHYERTVANFPKLLDLIDDMRPDIFYLANNAAFMLPGMNLTDLPTPDQVRAQLEAQRGELAQYRERGVEDVGFYRCAITMRGNPEARHGIFALHDRWDEYAEVFSLGPRPPEDPIEWLQIRFDNGRPYIRAWDRPDAGGNTGYFCCPNNPWWRQFTMAMVRTGATVGYTNLFVDNPSLFCKCRWCRERFAEYERERFSADEWAALFPDIPWGEADIEAPELSVERDRFWQDSMGEHLAAMKQAMREGNSGARVTLGANGAQMTLGPWYTSRANLMQYARAGVELGFKESPFEFSGVNLRPVGNGLLTVEPGDILDGYRLIRGTGVEGYRACPAQSYSNIGVHDNLYRLAMSEALAMDGTFVDGAAVGAEIIRAPMYHYLNRHRELFRPGRSIARVAVMIAAAEYYFDGDLRADATRDTYAIRDWLDEQQIPFDYLVDEAATQETLAGYDVVIVPGFRSLCDGADLALRAHVSAGASMILSLPAGTHHPAGPERATPLFADLVEGAEERDGWLMARLGDGTVIASPRHLADMDLPAGFSTTEYTISRPQTIGGKSRGPMGRVCVEANRARFLEALDLAAGRSLSVVRDTDMPGLRVAGRCATEGDDPWLVLHVINERVLMRFEDTGGGFDLLADGEPEQYRDVRLVLPLPEGFTARAVRWARVPQDEPMALEFEGLADGVACTLPAVELYSLVFVDLAPGVGAGESVAQVVGPSNLPHEGQGLYLADQSAVRLVPVPGGEPVEATIPLRLNFTHPALIHAATGDEVTVRIAAWGPEGKWARWWLVDPAGALLQTGAVACGKSADVGFTAEADGVYLVQAQAGAHDVSIGSPSHGVCFPATAAQRLNLTGAAPELYFHVPEDVAEIPLMLQTRDRDGVYEVIDPEGNVVARRDGLGQATVMDPGGAMVWSDRASGAAYQRVVVPVPEGQDGATWRLRFLASTEDSTRPSNLYFADDFPGLLSTGPDALLTPAPARGPRALHEGLRWHQRRQAAVGGGVPGHRRVHRRAAGLRGRLPRLGPHAGEHGCVEPGPGRGLRGQRREAGAAARRWHRRGHLQGRRLQSPRHRLADQVAGRLGALSRPAHAGRRPVALPGQLGGDGRCLSHPRLAAAAHPSRRLRLRPQPHGRREPGLRVL